MHLIDMEGPVLPHVIHSLCSLLQKTVQDFKIQTSTLKASTLFNVDAMS